MGKKAKTAQTAAPAVSNGVEKQQAEKKSEKKAESAAAAAASSKTNGSSMPPAPVPTPTKPSAERNEFLKLFWNLAESDAAARAQAVAHIIAHLQQKQTKADATFDEDLQYTLKRLVRGLASSRDAARQGFSTALAGLLETFPSVQLKEVQDLLREAMEVHSSMKGMEQREHMFGRLFGLLAVQRSGRLGGDDNQSVAVEVIKELLEMSKWKKWLREACFEAVLAVLVDVTTKVFVSDLVPEFSLYLQGDVSAFNAEQVLLAAGLHHYIHTAGIEDEVPSTFPALKFLRRKAMHALAEPLKTSSSCYPRVHAAWYGIFGHLIHTGKNAAQFDVELFQETWNVLVENVLLNKESATHERRGLAFKLFELVLPSLPSSLLRAILTPHFVKCLYTNAVSKKNYLHEAARHTLKVFAALAPEEYFHFFQKQFVKPMASLVEIDADDNDEDDEANSPEAKKARLSSGGFDAIIAIEEEKERAELLKKKHDNVRLWALDALVTSVSELLAKDDSEATEETNEKVQNQVLRFLVFHTFFTSSGKSTPSKKKKKSAAGAGASDVGLDAALTVAEPVLSNTVLATSLKRVLSLLSVKLSGESSSVLSRIFSISQELLAVGDAATLRHALADDVAEQMKTVASRVSEIRKSWVSAQEDKEDEAKTKQLEAFLLLFMSSGVQLLDPEQRSDAVVVVTDLEKCYSDLVTDKKAGGKKKASKKTKKQEAESESENEPNSIVVFTDMLMSLLSQDSSAMREIVAHVFRSMLPLLNAESIQTMLNVLVPSEEDDAEDQEDDRVTRRDDEDEEDSDEDMEGDDDEEESDEIVLTTATEVSEALSKDAKLAALHREDMALAAIVGHVKDRANRKKNAKKAVMQMLHFKLRVLDLLQVFVTKCATSPLVLSLVLPLFQALIAIQKTDKEARVLSERLQSVLNNKVLRARDVPSGAELSAAERTAATEHLNTVVELLTKKSLDKDQAGKVGAGVVVYYIRVLCGGKAAAAPAQGVQQAVRVAVMDAFTKKHSRFPQSVFDDLIARFPLIAVHLLLAPLTAIATATASEKEETAADSEESEGVEGSKTAVAVDEFSKCEVFRLLSLLLKPKTLAEKDEQKAFIAVKSSLKSALVALLAQELKAKRMKIVLSFALHFVKSWKLVTKDAKELEELMTVFTGLETNSPVVKNMVKQIVDASGSSIAAAALEKKDKADKIKKSEEDKAKKAKEQTPQAEEKAAEKAKKQLQKAVADKKKKSEKTPLKKRKRAVKADESDEE